VERNEVQMPIYYISRVLTTSEVKYSILEKLVLALVHASRRPRRYFQAHTVEVLTNFPLHQVLRMPEFSGRLTKWAIEIGGLDIEFKGRTAIKGQVIADFIAEVQEGSVLDKALPNEPANLDKEWKLYVDGASFQEGSGLDFSWWTLMARK
jgi:hypothetical protein